MQRHTNAQHLQHHSGVCGGGGVPVLGGSGVRGQTTYSGRSRLQYSRVRTGQFQQTYYFPPTLFTSFDWVNSKNNVRWLRYFMQISIGHLHNLKISVRGAFNGAALLKLFTDQTYALRDSGNPPPPRPPFGKITVYHPRKVTVFVTYTTGDNHRFRKHRVAQRAEELLARWLHEQYHILQCSETQHVIQGTNRLNIQSLGNLASTKIDIEFVCDMYRLRDEV